MATHKEIRERKDAALKVVFDHIRERKVEVKLADLYNFVGDVWKTNAHFVQDALNNAPADIVMTSRRRVGTFAFAIQSKDAPVIPIKRAVMGGLWPHNYEGRPVNIRPVKSMKCLKKIPKTFAAFEAETIGMYRIDKADEPCQYLQVTDSGNFLFCQV